MSPAPAVSIIKNKRMSVKRPQAFLVLALVLSFGCRKGATTSQDDKHSSSDASQRGNPRNVQSLEKQKSTKLGQSSDDSISLRTIIATCESLKKGDGTGAINVLELSSAYKELAKIDPKLALEHFSDPKSFYSFGPALGGVLEIVAARDPALMTEWLKQNLTGYEDINQAAPLVSLTLDKLAAADPERALALFKALEIPPTMKVSAIRALFKGLATKSPSEIIELSASIDPSLVPSALAGAVSGICGKDPAFAQTIASAISDPEVRRQSLDTVFASWFQSDSALASEELMKLDQKLAEELLIGGAQNPKSAFYIISQSNPGLLISMLDGLYPTSLNRDVFMKAVAQTVSGQTEKTFSMISQMPEGDMKIDLYKEAYSTLGREDPDGAMSMLAAETNPAIRAAALTQIAGSIGNRGMDESLRFLDQLNDKDEKSAVLSAAFNSICHSDLESAADYLTNIEEQSVNLSPQEKDRGCQVVAYRLASKSVDEARNWMSLLPSADQPQAMTGIAHQIAEKDVTELGNFLNSLEKDQAWAAGVRVMISTVESSDAQTASSWKQELKKLEGK